MSIYLQKSASIQNRTSFPNLETKMFFFQSSQNKNSTTLHRECSIRTLRLSFFSVTKRSQQATLDGIASNWCTRGNALSMLIRSEPQNRGLWRRAPRDARERSRAAVRAHGLGLVRGTTAPGFKVWTCPRYHRARV